jgi:hypothetical protein
MLGSNLRRHSSETSDGVISSLGPQVTFDEIATWMGPAPVALALATASEYTAFEEDHMTDQQPPRDVVRDQAKRATTAISVALRRASEAFARVDFTPRPKPHHYLRNDVLEEAALICEARTPEPGLGNVVFRQAVADCAAAIRAAKTIAEEYKIIPKE